VTGNGPPLFSRTDLLAGLPARRATAVLFGIENRTARLVIRSRRALERYVAERVAARDEQDFLAALAAGRDSPLRPSIRDLERHAPAWADLVASDPALRAAIAHRLAERHRFRRADVPRLRNALGLDDQVVAESYRRLFGQDVSSVYRERLPVTDRIAWTRSRLAGRIEAVPPFWWAFALTLTETVGAGVLALPIALAGVGILPAVGLLVVFGIVNVVTVAALVESITRNGAIRYGSSYLGRLVEDLLGRPGRLLLSAALFAVGVVSLPAYVIGVGSALGGATGFSPLLWIALLGLATMLILRRGSLDATVATAIVVGVINIALLVAISAIALAHADPARLAAVPPIADVSAGGLVFGVLLGAYFGHTAAATASKVVLARDPTGRSLLRGSVAAMACAVGLYVLVVVAVLGAVPAVALQGFAGTALEPLIGIAGPVVGVLGGLFVILAMGLATVISSLALYNQTLETLLERPWLERRLRDRRTLAWLAAATPILVVFVATTVLFESGSATFAGPMALLGTIGTPLVAGVFPMLLVLAARRRAEFAPGLVIPGLGHPVVVAAIVSLLMTGGLVQGWLVAKDPATEIATTIVAVLIGAVVLQALRSGAFRPRAVLEVLGAHRGGHLGTGLVVAGRPVAIEATSTGSAGADVSVDLPGLDEVAIWAHRVTDEGDTVPILLGVTATAQSAPRDLGVTDEEGRLTAFLGGVPTTILLRPSETRL
jgi:tyrosine-specific transport protein